MTANDHTSLQYHGDNPGAVKHGNFINYYKFNPANRRISEFPNQIFRDHVVPKDGNSCLRVLDIGCNSGEVSQETYRFLVDLFPEQNVRVLGLDIDESLINRAIEANMSPNIVFRHMDVMRMSAEDESIIQEFLAGSKFDLILCLSVTMWIHLNNSDDGLKEFLRRWSTACRMFIVEPQQWKNYSSAARRIRRSNGAEFENLKELKWREKVLEEIDGFLQGHDCKKRLVFKSTPTEWKRTISIYVDR